jgi:imidazolonepropionase-like amidohydrolase
MASRGTAWTPTAGTVLAAVAQLEAAGVEPLLALARPHLERLEEMVPLAARLGVTILAGTDMLGHGNLASEVAALQRLGLPAEDALDAASGAARAYFDLPAFGEGQTAEIVTYDDDPRDEPAVLTRPVAVVHAGRRVR